MKNKLLDIISNPIRTNEGKYDWPVLFELAKEQSVLGITFQGIQQLPSELRPPRNLLFQWIGYAEAIKKNNEKINECLVKLIQELEECGIEPLVVKGQINASEYAEPLSRQSGDIDVFIMKQQWNKVEQWIKDNKYMYSSTSAEKHIEINYHKITIEFHFHLNMFSSKSAMSYWQREIEDKAWERLRYVFINGKKIRTLGITDTLVYLMVHAHHHLITQGIGLRQMQDMYHFLKNHFNELDIALLHQHLHGIIHEQAFNAYLALINKYLGLSDNYLPVDLHIKDYVYADKIMEEIWRGANFGFKNNLNGVPIGFRHSLNTALWVLRHSVKFYALAPKEARTYWWHKILWRMKRKELTGM